MNPWHAGGLWHRPRPGGSTFLDAAADVAAELNQLTAAVHCVNQGSDLFSFLMSGTSAEVVALLYAWTVAKMIT
jgi:hypothetical protein